MNSLAEQVVALAGQLAGADAAALKGRSNTTRWGALDSAVELPLVGATEVHPALSSVGALASAHAAGFRSALAVPLLGVDVGTLWVLSVRPDAFGPEASAGLQRLGGLATSALAAEALAVVRFVDSLPSPAARVRNGLLHLNLAAEALFGCLRTSVPTVESFFHKVCLPGEASPALQDYESDRGLGFPDSRTLTIRRGDGALRLVDFTASCSDEDEVWQLSDVTERVASQERFRRLFEQSTTAYLLVDEGGIVDCNPAAVALLGYASRQDILKQSLKALSPEKQPDGSVSVERLAQAAAIAHEQGSYRHDWTLYSAVRGAVQVEATFTALTPMAEDGGKVMLVEWHDISERIRYQQGLERARDSALHFAKARSDFIATVSHEIRTPMNGVIGVTRLLLDTNLDEQQREYVDMVRACGEGLLALMNDVLDFSRLESGRIELESTPFSARDVAEDALSVVAGQAHAKGLELCCVMAPRVPQLVRGDPTRLRQLLLNLLSNAVKFTLKGHVVLQVDAGPGDDEGTTQLVFSVQDTGIGIKPDMVPRLFTAFSQEDASTTRRFGGSGLGLAISRRLAEAMGGRIDVATSSQGTTFTVTVPFPVLPVPVEERALAGRAVLVVHDHALTRQALRHLLEAAGAEVRETAAVAEGLLLGKQANALLVKRTLATELELGRLRGLAQSGFPVGLLSPVSSNAESIPGPGFWLPTPVRRMQLYGHLGRAFGNAPPTRVTPAHGVVRVKVGARVLVAEDNPVNQRVITGLLAKLGCEVVVAENGKKALERLEQRAFDVVLMDCQMPELDGYEATRTLRRLEAKGQHLPVVALTASVMEGDRQRCFEAGMDDFLAKPVRIEELERTLTRWTAQQASGLSGLFAAV